MMMSTFLYQKANTLGDWQSASVLAFIMILTTLIVMKGLDMVAKKVDRRSKSCVSKRTICYCNSSFSVFIFTVMFDCGDFFWNSRSDSISD